MSNKKKILGRRLKAHSVHRYRVSLYVGMSLSGLSIGEAGSSADEMVASKEMFPPSLPTKNSEVALQKKLMKLKLQRLCKYHKERTMTG